LLQNIYLPSLNVWKDPYTKDFNMAVLWQKYLETDKFQDLYLIQYWSDFAKGVWNEVFHEWVRPLDPLNEWLGIQKVPSMIVKVTRLLLSLVVALSVTMILYNGMTYIIQTWQWKEWKDLVKNVVYIVIWIIVSLFSITIITVLQSVSNSLDKESQRDRKRASDGKIIYNDEKKWILWGNSFNKRDWLDE
jgi:hypothetical protein